MSSTLFMIESPILMLEIILFFLFIVATVWKSLMLWSLSVRFLTLEYWLSNWTFMFFHFYSSNCIAKNLAHSTSSRSLSSSNLSSRFTSLLKLLILLSIFPKLSSLHFLSGSLRSLSLLSIGYEPCLDHSLLNYFLKQGWDSQVFRNLKGFGPQLFKPFKYIRMATWSEMVVSQHFRLIPLTL